MFSYKVVMTLSIQCYVHVGVGNLYERVRIGFLRRWAASECLEQIKADDLFTNCISIGPVSCETKAGD